MIPEKSETQIGAPKYLAMQSKLSAGKNFKEVDTTQTLGSKNETKKPQNLVRKSLPVETFKTPRKLSVETNKHRMETRNTPHKIPVEIQKPAMEMHKTPRKIPVEPNKPSSGKSKF